MKTLEQLTRKNVWQMKPYSSARDEYQGAKATVFLDANENPYNAPFNRYPDPRQWALKKEIARIKQVKPEQIFLGNGSDEAIDLPFRAFCQPGVDNVVAIDPTYGMYQVCAETNDVEYRKVKLDDQFQFTAVQLLQAADDHTKLIFLCSPNNPTGNDLHIDEIRQLLTRFEGLVIVDEAYIDFSDRTSFLAELERYPNLIVLQTFSKAWGSAAIRLGMAFASYEIIAILNKIKYPYNVNQLTQLEALRRVKQYDEVKLWVKMIKEERAQLMEEVAALPLTRQIFPTDANFFLVRVSDAVSIYRYLVEQGVIVRNRHSVTLCNNCLRITIGTPEENLQLLQALKQYGE